MNSADSCVFYILQELEKKVRQQVDKTAEQSLTDPEPPLDELYRHVYHQTPNDFRVRGCDSQIWS